MSKSRQPKHDKQLSRCGRRDHINGPVHKRLARHVTSLLLRTAYILCSAKLEPLLFDSFILEGHQHKGYQIFQRQSMWHLELHCSKENSNVHVARPPHLL